MDQTHRAPLSSRSRRHRNRRTIAIVAIVLALLVAACGSYDRNPVTAQSSTTTRSRATTSTVTGSTTTTTLAPGASTSSTRSSTTTTTRPNASDEHRFHDPARAHPRRGIASPPWAPGDHRCTGPTRRHPAERHVGRTGRQRQSRRDRAPDVVARQFTTRLERYLAGRRAGRDQHHRFHDRCRHADTERTGPDVFRLETSARLARCSASRRRPRLP